MVVGRNPLLALVAPVLLLLGCGGACLAVGVRLEAELALPPNGNATVRTGPSAGPRITDFVSVDSNAGASNGAYVGYFDYWEWMEWDAVVPEDGVYEIQAKYATNAGVNNYVNLVVSVYTAGPQVTNAVLPVTGNYVPVDNPATVMTDEFGAPVAVPLKAGTHRVRMQIRPDPNYGTPAGWLNLDYIELVKKPSGGEFPSNLQLVQGTVTVSVNGSPMPVEGALVSVGPEYTTAAYVARTGADGRYTMWLPATSQSLTVLVNGWAKVTATVTPPATKDFALTEWSGRIEGELLDSTNAGREWGNGVQPEFTTVPNSLGVPRSNYGQLVNFNVNKFAEWRHIYAPAAGVYDLGMYYSAGIVGIDPPYGRVSFTLNGGATTDVRYDVTSTDFLTYAQSVSQMVDVKAGMNLVRLSNPDQYASANVDYITLTPTTRPYGYLKVVVQSQTGLGLSGASVKIDGGDTTTAGTVYTGPTGGDGSFQVPVPPGTYAVTVSRTGKVGTGQGTVTAGGTTTVTIVLTVTAATVEGESFTASGPNIPSVDIADSSTASGGKVITDLSAKDRPEWVEWNLDAAQDGMYQLVLGYATSATGSGAHTLWVKSTSFQYVVADGLIPTADSNDYQVMVYPTLIPLKAGSNTLRMTMDQYGGGINIDYLTFERISALPATKTASGTVKGSDGTGQAAIQNAVLFLNTSDPSVSYVARSSGTGEYTLVVPSTQGFVIGSMAEGYTTIDPAARPGFGNITWNPVMNVNNEPDPTTPPTMRVFARSAVVYDTGINLDWAAENQPLWGTSPGKFYEFIISMPRSGMYEMGMWYSSGWNSGDGNPVRTTFTINGLATPVNFPKTESWADYLYRPAVASLPFAAGPNTVRVTYLEAGANVGYFTFKRTGDLVLPGTDLNNNGKTTLEDAVLYNRRLNSLDTGATPDFTGDGTSGTADVVYIMRIAGGLSAG